MPRVTDWKDLKFGLITAVVLVALVASILLFARVGAIRGERFTLFMKTADATGVVKGTEVWLAGQKVGLVTTVDYLPSAITPEDNLLVGMEIRGKDFTLIREDSRVDIRPGGNLIGSPVVFITGGTAISPPAKDGDTLKASPRSSIEGITTTMGRVGGEVSALATDVGQLVEKMKSPTGTTGAFVQSGIPSLTGTSTEFSRLKNRMMNGSGTTGLAMRNGLFGRTTDIMSSVDSLRSMLATGDGNIGRFRRDSTLGPTVKGILAQVDSLRAIAAAGIGSVGRARGDSTLTSELARARRELDALMKDMKKHPLRYIAF